MADGAWFYGVYAPSDTMHRLASTLQIHSGRFYLDDPIPTAAHKHPAVLWVPVEAERWPLHCCVGKSMRGQGARRATTHNGTSPRASPSSEGSANHPYLMSRYSYLAC